MKNKVWLFWEV